MDIDNVEPEFAKREFLAVLITGFGNELLPLTSDNGDEPCPKPLLPVANKPLLEYVLSWLEQSGINDVLLICPAIHQPALYHHINSDISSSSLRVDLQTYDETQESTAGTCQLLRHFAPRITEDFVLVPCDFITPPSLPLSTLLNKFRIESTSHGAIVSTCWYPAYIPEKGILFDEWGPVPAPPAIVWDPASESLLHIDTPDDHDKNVEEIEVKMDLLTRHPRTKLSSSFQDSHVYICQRKVLSLLQAKPRLESFKQHFIPWLCKLQYQSQKQRKYTDRKSLHFLGPRAELKYSLVLNKPGNQSNHVSQSLSLKHSTLSNDIGTLDILNPNEDEASKVPTFKISITIHSLKNGLALRINNLYTFLEANRSILANTVYSLPTDPKNRSLIDQKVQISPETIVGDSTQIAERTMIKRSVVGRHCKIGKNVKITNCILFDHCVVEDGAKLEGCILGKNTKIGTKSDLTRCITCAGFEVNGGDTLKGEKLDSSDWTSGIAHSRSSNEGDSSDDEDDSE